ncbi:hypothetical protein TNIN_95241 [Trichonephila inaurata madagascariensis]|uniref:Uncharacterized protein n=1 Tax=Trichonephila inaurata madagascariensis TaxID=2747483 RepID=A0A8X6M4V8_9ARAC|nr:hypothetical protein TNIN_95241 [Trichonephila inaurata madagascariensis]
MYSLFLRKTGQRKRNPTTKNCAPQTTAICGSGERQPPRVQWMAYARGSLLCDQGIPSARNRTLKTGQRERSPTTKNYAPQTTAICGSGERQPPRVQ